MTEIREPDAATLEAVYNLNKHAKKYARLADENYRRGKGATARANSLKKKALYSVKDAALKEILRGQEPDRVERHMIDGTPFWCFYYGEWSFHLPADRVDHGPFRQLPGLCADTAALEDFESAEEKEHSDLSLKACLLHLEVCGINANDHLEETHVQYGRNRHFAGWSYLGDGGQRLEEADR